MKKQTKPKINIFWKTFLITTTMLIGITFVAFTLVYMFLPEFYQNHKIETYNDMVNSRLAELENTDNIQAEVDILSNIFHGSSSPFRLLDSNGLVLFQLEVFHRNVTIAHTNPPRRSGEGSIETVIIETSERLVNEVLEIDWGLELGGRNPAFYGRDIRVVDASNHSAPIGSFSLRTINFEDTFLSLPFYYTTNSGYNRTLEIAIPLSPLADAQTVVMSMYPFAVLFSIIFALLVAFIFSRWIANPIKKIQYATSRMSKLEPNVTIATRSRDEIGILSHDIGRLYEQLRGTIVTLEQEVSRYSDAENKKIEFLQSVSHEMKTPLASANALLEGIIYEVSPYHENQKQYLEECREFLQRTIQLTKESLNLSEQYKKREDVYNLADIIKETSNLYGVIFMVKQLSYHEDVPGNISIRTKKHLLSKVLSNLFSNAANYTAKGGQVRVSYDAGVLTVFNNCKPLSQEQVDEIFKPLMTQDTAEHATGLGLFIVKQLLRQLRIEFIFVPSADGTGMEFKLWLPLES